MYVPILSHYGCELMIGIEETGADETIEGIHQCHHCFPESPEGFSGKAEEYCREPETDGR
jgi:hypothetical protein